MPEHEKNSTGARPRQTALITGASYGIGYELTRIFAADRYDLVLVARDDERLNQVKSEVEGLHGVTARVIAADLSRPEAPDVIFRELERDAVCVDVLVNNAGFGGFGRFTGTALENEIEMLQVNVAALTHLTKLFLRGMVTRGRGRVLNVASVAGFLPGPLHAVYHASKAYVLSFSEAISRELDGTEVTVTALCPGPTKTDFFVRAGAKRTNRYRGLFVMDTAFVAQVGYRGMLAGKTVVIPGLWNKLVAFSARLLPRRAATWIVRAMQSGRRGETR